MSLVCSSGASLPDLHTEVLGVWRHPYSVSVVPHGFGLFECRGAEQAGLWLDASAREESSELPFLRDILITEGSGFAL